MIDKKFSTTLFKTFVYLLLFFACIYLFLTLTNNQHLIKAVRSTYLVGTTGPGIYDQSKFIDIELRNSSKPYHFPHSNELINLSKTELDSAAYWETKSLIVVKNDSIKLEQYFNATSKETQSNSFSVAKSLVSVAIGVAIKKGHIGSINDAIELYLPEFKGKREGKITIKHLLEMNSGIDFGESYGDPFGFMAKAYYGKELYNLTINKTQTQNAGEVWKYQGGNTLLLSFILKAACGQSLSSFFEQEVWSKIGSEYPANWTISDHDSLERAYCCFYSSAIDLAKVGRLYLNYGNWFGEQLIDSAYIKASIEPQNIKDENGKLIDYYGFQWWLGKYQNESFYYARGILGQYIVVFPNQNLILVRQGHKRDKTKGVKVPRDLYLYLGIAAQAFD